MDVLRSNSRLPLVFAIFLAAILQALLIARTPTISADGIIFISIARDLAEDPAAAFRRHDQHPGYPALLLAAARTVQCLGYRDEPQSWMVAGLGIVYVCGLLSVWVVWRFARDLFDQQVANIAALIFACLPVPRGCSADALSDTPHVLLYLLAAWLASSAVVSGRLLPLAGAGLASGAAYWIRPEGLEVCLVALACLAWQAWRSGWAVRRWCLSSATLGFCALLVVSPYLLLAGKITSKQIPFAKQQATQTYIGQLAKSSDPAPKPAEVPVPAPAPAIAAQPTAPAIAATIQQAQVPVPAKRRYTAALVLRLVGKSFGALLNSICQGFKFVFIPFYLLGNLAMFRRKPEWLRIEFVALLAAVHIVILLAVYVLSGYIARRHSLPLVALAMPFTALGVQRAGEIAAHWLNVQPGRLAAATLAGCCAVVLPYTIRSVNHEFVPVIEATRWVQSRAEPGSGIVCNSPYVSFYGTLPVTYLGPDGLTLAEAVAHAKTAARYDYVVLHVNAHDYRPEWLTQLTPHYRQVRQFDEDSSTDSARPRKVLIFEAKESQARRPASDAHS